MPDTPRSIFYRREIPPCRDCQDRHMRCHSKCDRYSEWRDKSKDSYRQARNHYKVDRESEDYDVSKRIRLGKRYKR